MDEVESLLFALEHHVLVGTATEQSLEKDDCLSLFVFGVKCLCRHITVGACVLPSRSGAPDRNLCLFLLFARLCCLRIHIVHVDKLLGLIEGSFVGIFFPGEVLFKIESNL